MAKQIQRLSDTSNIAILNSIRNSLGNDYAARVPEATKASVRETAAEIMSHRPTANAFLDQLINRIGSVIVRNNSWTNPLAEFKRGMLEFGDTIEEIQVGLIQARSYNPHREYLEKDIFGTHSPHVEANYHTMNRQEFYPISVKREQLQQAFLSSTGLYELINAVLQVPMNSDNWDEFLLMCSLFAQYEQNGGYHRIHVPDARSIDAGSYEAKQVIKKVRATAEDMTFMSGKYNAAGMPIAANREDLVLFSTPDFNATVDVDALAGAFNLERSTLAGRQVTIPADKFGLDGAQAILTTKDFFVVADQLLENTSAENPVGLTTNYFLHHWQVISQSRFAPAVLFHTGVDDTQAIEIRGVDGVSEITLTYRDGTDATGAQPRGAILVADATATSQHDDGPTVPAVYWSLTGNDDPTTRISQHGTVHIGGRETANSVKITATATFIDPEQPGGETTYSRSRNITIDADSPMIPQWPNERPGGETDYTQPDEPEEPEEPAGDGEDTEGA